MFRLGSLSSFFTGLIVTIMWPLAAMLWWARPEMAVGIALLAALAGMTIAVHVGRLPYEVRVGLALVSVFVHAATAGIVMFTPAVVLFASTTAIVLSAGMTGALEARSRYHRPGLMRARDGVDMSGGVTTAAVLTAFVMAINHHDDIVMRATISAALGMGALGLARVASRTYADDEDHEIAAALSRTPRRLYLVAALASGLPWIPGAVPEGEAFPALSLLVSAAVIHASRAATAQATAVATRAKKNDDQRGSDALSQAGSILEWISERPPRALVVTFGAMGLAGGVLLALPVSASATQEHGLAWIDALFTSFSAVCVTGLIVVDTPVDLSVFGQVVVLVLIQIGGLGIMTFSTAAYTWLGGRMSVRAEATAARLANVEDRRQIGRSVRTILRGTFIFEALGAAILFVAFMASGDDAGPALWRAVFTSISAFCNAGFALQSDSLIGYQENHAVLLTISGLIIVGGVGPIVTAAALHWDFTLAKRGPRRPLGAQPKLVLYTTGLLLVVPWMCVAAFEWNNTLDHLRFDHRLVNALFQSVTLRTAGFNSVDFALLHPATLALAIPVMFIGGSPGSTAGGIKTTTFALLTLNMRATLRSDEATVFEGKAISRTSSRNAITVLFLGVGAVFLLTLLLLLTQGLPLQAAVFEATSALATVGLSTGATGELDEVGKVAILIGMFAGRIGPLTLLLGLAAPGARGLPADRYPETNIEVG